MTFNFNTPYNRENWIEFIKTKLLPDDFKENIENVKDSIDFKLNRFEKLTFLGESKSLNLVVYEITHKSEFDPRVSLSKEAFRMMANFSKRKALVFFVPENAINYRLSLITIDLELKGKKIQKFYSNPRRFSFLMGADAKRGTIHDKLLNAKTIDTTKRIDNFNDLKERFSVESVSKQFFKEYRELYENIKTTFNNIPVFNIVASKHIDSDFLELFSRKLLGQIVFIYFLQRKKWLGGNPSNKKWDDGKKDFLRWAFKYCEQNNLNFFDSFLEKLFYKGFNEKDDSFEINKTYIKVPFLNGGLFEKFYKSDETLILHPPNSLFSNKQETGILDIFDKYNFTIDENTFFEQEVAVDPEMLGKVFENLLPENLRKGKGTYYTPREIVSYMTRESLINFLKTKLQTQDCEDNIIDEKIRRLFDYKDFYISKKESEEYGKEFEKQFYEMLDIVENVNNYLKEIKIVDPAVGSGAFPMGILLEIVSLREYIEKEFLNNKKISSYELKKETIQNSIYGVDIDPGAVEIAKLRFWLSLVVDAEKPESLPNLDYKIMQGNSLIESFAGIDIGKNKEYKQKAVIDHISKVQAELNKVNAEITKMQSEVLEAYKVKNPSAKRMMEEMNLQHKEKKKIEKKLNKLNQEMEVEEYDRTEVKIINKIHNKQNELYIETYRRKKEELRAEIENLIVELFDEKLNFIKEEQNTILKLINEKLDGIINLEERNRIEQNERNKYEVLKFDIQKAEYELHKYTKKDKIRPFFPWHLYFAEVFNEGGFDIVIGNPPYGFRKVLSKEEKAYFRKERKIKFTTGDIAELFIIISLGNLVKKEGTLTFIIPKKSLYGESWKNVRQLWCSNDLVFLMDASKAFEKVLLEQASFSLNKCDNKNNEIYVGYLNQKINKVEVFGKFDTKNIFSKDLTNAQIYKGLYKKELLRKIEEKSLIDSYNYIKAEIGISNITKFLTYEEHNNYPCVKGIDIIKYGLKKQKRYIDENIAKQFIEKYQEDKIVAQEIIAHIENPYPHIMITIFFDDKGRLFNDTCVELKTLKVKLNKKFLMSYLQSRFCNWFCYNFIYNRAIRTMHFINYYVLQIPIPKVIIKNESEQQPFIKLVDQILLDKKAGKATQHLEDKIDLMVYKLYELTYDEVLIVDPECPFSKEEYEKFELERAPENESIVEEQKTQSIPKVPVSSKKPVIGKPVPKKVEEPAGNILLVFTVGQHVIHPTFGEGEVQHVAGTGEKATIHVKFGKQTKKLVAGYAKMRGV